VSPSSNRATICSPASRRHLVIVRRPGTSTRRADTPAAASVSRSTSAGPSDPVAATSSTSAPSAARFIAVFAAPPGAYRLPSRSSTATGASRHSRPGWPVSQPSSNASPSTSTRRPAKRATISASVSCSTTDAYPALRVVLMAPDSTRTAEKARRARFMGTILG